MNTALTLGVASDGTPRTAESRERDRALRLWWTQLAFNGAWSPLFFSAHRPGWALADLAALAGSLSAYVVTAKRVDASAARLVYPYLAWVAFAGVLNAEIVRRNPPRRAR